MKREIINLRYKILMRKPRMAVTVKKNKKVKSGCASKHIHENNNSVLYEDIQNLQCGGMQSPRIALS